MAFERLFLPFLPERVLHEQGGLLVVDKPPGLVVHGGDARSGQDLVTRLKSWLTARGQDSYLGVHQRLDTGTSGVLLFARERALNATLAAQFEQHRLERVYVAAIGLPAGARSLADSGRLEHRLHFEAGVTRVVSSGGQRAVTAYRVLERRGARALVELRPETGRTHQLRAQLAAIGAAIAGDRLYGGPRASRLMLHARKLALSEPALSFEADLPAELVTWTQGREHELGSAARLERRIQDAGVARAPLAAEHQALRLLNGPGDGVPGVVVDCYGQHAVLSVSSDEAFERRHELGELLVSLGARGAYLKVHARADARRLTRAEIAPEAPIAGQRPSGDGPARLALREGERRFWVTLDDGLSTGLFVDQRENRRRVAELSRGASVLNLFCYTCAFSVAAAQGGASRVTSVDLSARALERGRENFRLNGLDPAAHAFVEADVLDWLGRAARKAERYGLIVLDPPSFSTGKRGGAFRVERDYAQVAAAAIALLAPGGRLLAITNHRKTSLGALRRKLRAACDTAKRRALALKDLPSPLDCPPDWDAPWPAKSVLLSVE